jgi:hypothetical protein
VLPDPVVTWAANDTWTWIGTDGTQITDVVKAVHLVTPPTAKGTKTQRTPTRTYDVISTTSNPAGLAPRVVRETLNASLGVINATSGVARVNYTAGGTGGTEIPLTFLHDGNFTANVFETIGNATVRWITFTTASQADSQVQEYVGEVFGVRHVHLNISVVSPSEGVPRESQAERYFNATVVKNDVAFERDGTGYHLVSFHVGGTGAGDSPGPSASLPGNAFWLPGWSWHYAASALPLTVTRTAVLCTTPFFPACGSPSGCAVPACTNALAIVGGHKYYVSKDVVSYGIGTDAADEQEILSLYDANTFRVAYSQELSETYAGNFSPTLTYSPPGLPANAFPGTVTLSFGAVGMRPDARFVNDTANATVTVSDPGPMQEPAGAFSAMNVTWSEHWQPTSGQSGLKPFDESGTRWWSASARNDIEFRLILGGFSPEVHLDLMSLGGSLPPTRDL